MCILRPTQLQGPSDRLNTRLPRRRPSILINASRKYETQTRRLCPESKGNNTLCKRRILRQLRRRQFPSNSEPKRSSQRRKPNAMSSCLYPCSCNVPNGTRNNECKARLLNDLQANNVNILHNTNSCKCNNGTRSCKRNSKLRPDRPTPRSFSVKYSTKLPKTSYYPSTRRPSRDLLTTMYGREGTTV